MTASGETSARSIQRWAVTVIVIGAMATAFNPVFVRLSDLEPAGSAFHRMLWALPLMWAWMRFDNVAPAAATRPSSRRDRWLLVLCGLFFAADLTALHWSIQLTSVANAILFLNAQPIYVVTAAWVLFGERASTAFIAAVATAVLGAVIMLGESAHFGDDRLLGDSLAVVAGVCYAGYILTAGRLRSRASSATINAWTCLIACPPLLAVALITGQSVIPGSPEGWALMIGLGVVSQACGQGFIVAGMGYLPAGFAAVVLLSAPVASAFFGWALLSETMTAQQIVGILVVLSGIYMAHRARLATSWEKSPGF